MKHILATIALLTAGTANAMTGNVLLQRMTGSESDRSMALGYIAGISSGLEIAGVVCFPDSATIGQGYDIVKSALESTPSIRHKDAAVVSGAALGLVFPCKKPAKAAPSTL